MPCGAPFRAHVGAHPRAPGERWEGVLLATPARCAFQCASDECKRRTRRIPSEKTLKMHSLRGFSGELRLFGTYLGGGKTQPPLDHRWGSTSVMSRTISCSFLLNFVRNSGLDMWALRSSGDMLAILLKSWRMTCWRSGGCWDNLLIDWRTAFCLSGGSWCSRL